MHTLSSEWKDDPSSHDQTQGYELSALNSRLRHASVRTTKNESSSKSFTSFWAFEIKLTKQSSDSDSLLV